MIWWTNSWAKAETFCIGLVFLINVGGKKKNLEILKWSKMCLKASDNHKLSVWNSTSGATQSGHAASMWSEDLSRIQVSKPPLKWTAVEIFFLFFSFFSSVEWTLQDLQTHTHTWKKKNKCCINVPPSALWKPKHDFNNSKPSAENFYLSVLTDGTLTRCFHWSKISAQETEKD